MRTIVCVPTYNEAGNIAAITARLRAAVPEADVLIADDNSPDGTGDIADRLAAEDRHVHVMHRTAKEGLGAAYLACFRWALDHDYEVVVEHDADGSHRPEELPRLLQAIEDGADMVKGSRWVRGGSVVNWPLHRKLLSVGGSAYIRLVLGLPYRDITGGFNAFRADTLRAIIDKPIDTKGYGIQRDLTLNAHRAGFRIVEVPIEFKEREVGDSKMGGAVVREAMVRTTQLGLQHRAQQLRGVVSRVQRRPAQH